MGSIHADEELAAFAWNTDRERMAAIRARLSCAMAVKKAQGVYYPGATWRVWLNLVDEASHYVASRPELAIKRDAQAEGKFAHSLATRKAAARRLAERFGREHGGF